MRQLALVLDAVRSPYGLRGGVLSKWHPVDLAAEVLTRLLERAGVPPGAIDAVVIGCASQVGAQSANIARRAALAAGWPEEVAAVSLECHAASSAQAVVVATQSVVSEMSEVVVAGGVEVMSAVPLGAPLGQPVLGKPLGRRLQERYGAAYITPGLAAEELARRCSLGRSALDGWVLSSYKKALAAQRRPPAYLTAVPVLARGGQFVVRDEALEHAPQRGAVRALAPAYCAEGVITAANMAAEGDGASGVIVASERAARKLGVRPLARLRSLASVGGTPALWPLTTERATRRALGSAGLSVAEVDRWYVYESSAAAVLAWAASLGVPLERVNPEGGELASTSPVGAVGAGLFAMATAAIAEGRGERVGLCVAGEAGVAVAGVLDAVQ